MRLSDSPGLWIYLVELYLMLCDWRALSVEDDKARAGRALVDSSYEWRHGFGGCERLVSYCRTKRAPRNLQRLLSSNRQSLAMTKSPRTARWKLGVCKWSGQARSTDSQVIVALEL